LGKNLVRLLVVIDPYIVTWLVTLELISLLFNGALSTEKFIQRRTKWVHIYIQLVCKDLDGVSCDLFHGCISVFEKTGNSRKSQSG